jgi:cytochrome c553
MPGLAGQSKEALVRTLKEFKGGKRPATVMHQLAGTPTGSSIDRRLLRGTEIREAP